MKKLIAILFVIVLFTSCSALELPAPKALYEEITENIDIGEMYDLSDEMLEDVTGITSDLYTEAIYMTYGTGISPEEIIIIKAVDSASLTKIQEKLEKRLAYIKKSAENYLVEELPTIEKAVIRQDGLTLSLIVSSKVEEITELYNSYKKVA